LRLTDVAEVARRLRDLDIEGVFVGGATVAALVTDPASVPPRYTEDVDVVVPADSRLKYEQVEERLRAAGYAQPMGEHPICRWMIGGILVDLMPLLPEILGFGNRWYISALSSARVFRVDHTQFRLIDAPHLLATKLEAHFSRGVEDPMMSRDLTDILVIIDGRPELSQELAEAPGALRSYIASGVQKLLDQDLEGLIPGHLPADSVSQARAPVILQRVLEIAQLDG
jgi:predicted nucleotidyltransferase